jgi:uncharacterized DUF497 family protein
MEDEHFEWDDEKAAQNVRKHGVTFEMARDAFRDAFAIEWLDESQTRGERRFGMLASVESRILFVAYVMRGERIRIISVRKAEPYELRRYHEENS